MSKLPISIISPIDGDMQAWTFYIEEKDLVAIMDKYGTQGTSTRGNANEIANEIAEIWKER